MKEKKLMILVDNFGYGGLQKSGYFLANGLKRDGYNVTFCSLENIEPVWKLQDGIHVEKMSFTKKNNSISLLESLKTSKHLKKIIKEYKCDTIIALGDITLFVAYFASFFLFKKPKIIGSERNSPLKYSSKWKYLMNFLFLRCNTIVFQTKGAQECYSMKIREKSVIIPNPYIAIDNVVHREREKNYIATAAARFEYKKGIDILIQAFSIFVEHFPDYKLVIIGDGALKHDYINLSKKLCIEDKIIFTGKKKNVIKEIIDCKFFVLPSRLEGIPNMLMEVMGAGIPAIASDCHPGGPRMLTDNGNAGLLFKTEDYIDLANKMELLIKDDELRHKIGKLEKNRMKEFAPDKILMQWKNILE